MAVNRFYSSTAQETTLASGISDSDLTATVGGTTGFPVSYPYTLIIDRGTASEEIVEVTAAAGTTLTITRGVDSTSAVSHSTGATVVHGISARDHREPQQHIAASTGVHGVVGSVVGTTDSQTLTNKTLTAPTINNGTWASANLSGQPTLSDFTNAAHDHGDTDDGGNIPQSSVTNLVSDLATITTVNGTQTTDIAALDTRLDTAESNITTNATNITTANTNITTANTNISALQSPPAAILKRTTNQTIADSTLTAVLWDAEDLDTANGHSTSSNTSRYTAAVAGYYSVSASVAWQSTGSSGARLLTFRVNGATTYAGSEYSIAVSGVTINSATRLIFLGVGDYVEAVVFQSSGISLTIDSASNGGSRMDIYRVRG